MENLEHLLLDVKESLEREMRQGFGQVNARLDHLTSRFDGQALRLDRQAGLWQAGSRWSSSMDVWAEKIDTAIEKKDLEITELRERVRKLERKSE